MNPEIPPTEPPPTGSAAAPKKGLTGGQWAVIAGGAVAVIAVLVSANQPYEPDRDVPPPVFVKPDATVVYELGGSVGWADVTMATPTGTSQITPDVPLVTTGGDTGLTYTFPDGAFVYISAQKTDEGGTITCRITVDGVVISENTSSAAYGIATCEGSA